MYQSYFRPHEIAMHDDIAREQDWVSECEEEAAAMHHRIAPAKMCACGYSARLYIQRN